MRYLSVCSGIGSDHVAWAPLGWECAAFAEIDPQASAVLAHRFPDIPNHGDFTTIEGDEYGEIGLLAGGTPCQSFSVAGLRAGLDDDRGNLALEFCRLAARTRPRWIVWENVPGVLSLDGGRAFGSIVGALEELGYGVAWRMLDAQYVRVESHPRAVPQRRRRVFLVGYLGDWRPPVGVLLEPEGLRRHPPPRREAGKDVAGTLASRASAGGGLGTDFECGGGLVGYGGGRTSGPVEVAACLAAHGVRQDFEVETFICQEQSPPLTGNPYGDHESREGLLIPFDTTQITSAENRSQPKPDDPCHPLTAGGHPPAVGFSCKDHGADAGAVSPTLRAMGHDSSHPNAGGQVAVAFDARQDPCVYEEHTGAHGSKLPPHAVAVSLRGREGGGTAEVHEGVSPALRGAQGGGDKQHVMTTVVRRITPTECEALQGLPRNHTLVPYRGKPMRDGPRYRLCGNGIAVNCLSWIGQRIAMFEKLERCPN